MRATHPLQMPHFPDTALKIVQAYCEDIDEGHAKTGFIALNFLLKYRPPMRSRALPVLLKYTRSVREPLRRRAMEVSRKFWKVSKDTALHTHDVAPHNMRVI